jgi:hypothetical protein
MNWRTKAAIQRVFARLPVGGEAAYFQLQRRFGNLRYPESPLVMFRHAAEIFAELRDCGTPVENARVLEVGTGHRLNMPLAFFLAGAASVITVDLYRILKWELVKESVHDIAAQRDAVIEIFRALDKPDAISARLDSLENAATLEDLSRAMNLDYRAPGDATAIGLPPNSIDLHFSYTVFEHIPGPVLVRILREASRLISAQGLICHHIDLSDHFSHSDSSIGKINFLRFPAAQWRGIENERFGYQNRLRVTDYRQIYKEAGQDVRKWIEIVDGEALKSMRSGFPLAPEYQTADLQALATVSVRAISCPNRS